MLAFQVFGDSCYSVVIKYQGLQARKLWKAFENDDIVVRQVYTVKLILQRSITVRALKNK